MSASAGTPHENPAIAPGGAAGRGQRFGHVTGRRASAGRPGGHEDSYLVRDDETGVTYSFGYADIVTEGFRAIRTGERVRFLTGPADRNRAVYVIRLDLPDVEEYYK
jgi:hypothetical protein